MPRDRREWPPGIVRVHWHPSCCDLQPRRLRSQFGAKYFLFPLPHPERSEGSRKAAHVNPLAMSSVGSRNRYGSNTATLQSQKVGSSLGFNSGFATQISLQICAEPLLSHLSDLDGNGFTSPVRRYETSSD